MAEAVGADYLGVTVWETPTKADAVPTQKSATEESLPVSTKES